VLRKIFGTKQEDVTREYRKLHNEELYLIQIVAEIPSKSKGMK
jgi:hypothetical protein